MVFERQEELRGTGPVKIRGKDRQELRKILAHLRIVKRNIYTLLLVNGKETTA